MSKQIKAFLLIFVMMVSIIFSSNTVFAAGGSVEISCEANNGEVINAREYFTLVLTITNNGEAPMTDIEINFGKSSSFIPSGGPKQSFEDSIGVGETDNEDYEMFYSGGKERELQITIHYKDASAEKQSISKTIDIDNAIPSDDSNNDGGGGGNGGGSTIDKADFKPVLEITSDTIPEGKAGGTINIPLTISNMAKYEAREIRITPTLPENVFIVDQMTVYETIDKIRAEKSSAIDFQFEVDKYAKAGTYSIPLTISYKNVYGVDFSVEKEIYIKIINENLPPQLVVREGKTSPSIIKTNESFNLTFDVWNMGTLEAKNVTVDVNPNDNFFVLDNVTKKYLFEMNGLHNEQITYNLKSKSELESGTYAITVLLDHDDADKVAEYTLYVTVEGEEDEEGNVDIITENIKTPQEAVLTEQPFTVGFDIKNIGLTNAEDVKISVEPGETILPQSLNVLTIANLEPGESTPVSFSFIPSKDCESKSYPIKAIIEYKNGEEQVKKEQYMGVLIETDEEETTLNTIPKIIISEYSSDPGMVKAGENFTLDMSFLNTSKIKSVQNMKITLVVDETGEETGGSVFTPVQSSNTFYIDKLEPGETSDKEMVMYTIPDAQAKTYVVKAMFEYEYEEDGQLKTNNMEDLFGIPVIQPAKLEVTEVIVSEPAFVGEPLYISSEFYNMGRVKLSNLMIKVEGDFDTRESNYFVGNFDIGYGDYYEASITPLQPGETKGKLVYTFEDAAGEEHRIETEFTVNAMEAEPVVNPFPGEMYPGDMGMNPGMEEQATSKFPLIPVIIGGVVLVGVIVLIIVLKRRKKRKEMMLDEDI